MDVYTWLDAGCVYTGVGIATAEPMNSYTLLSAHITIRSFTYSIVALEIVPTSSNIFVTSPDTVGDVVPVPESPVNGFL